MKIIPNNTGKTSLISGGTSSKKNKTSSTLPFLTMIDDHADDPILELMLQEPDQVLSNVSMLAEELDKIGQELAEKPLPENFLRYKKHIRILLKGIAHNVQIKEVTARVGFTRTKLFKTAQAIDQALADLTDKILHDEKNRMEILKLTGLLKGLILDLFA